MCVYGYCRISTKQQSIERQIRNIKAEYDKAVIITEAYSGTKMNRPEWNKLYKKASPDTSASPFIVPLSESRPILQAP